MGFDNGTIWGSVSFQAKQFGSVLRGFGPPVPEAGVKGDLYLDTQTWFLYTKRAEDQTDPWGHYLFQVPATYRSGLKWFSAAPPTNDFGVTGDYCLAWAGWSNYGMQPSLYGPRVATGWQENGVGPGTVIDPTYAGFALPVGLSAEGTQVAFSSSTQMIADGLTDELILALPVPMSTARTKAIQLGLQSGAASVALNVNPLYTALDERLQ